MTTALFSVLGRAKLDTVDPPIPLLSGLVKNSAAVLENGFEAVKGVVGIYNQEKRIRDLKISGGNGGGGGGQRMGSIGGGLVR